jgi:hypothetical protein
VGRWFARTLRVRAFCTPVVALEPEFCIVHMLQKAPSAEDTFAFPFRMALVVRFCYSVGSWSRVFGGEATHLAMLFVLPGFCAYISNMCAAFRGRFFPASLR